MLTDEMKTIISELYAPEDREKVEWSFSNLKTVSDIYREGYPTLFDYFEEMRRALRR